jgi:hypothetical protein
MLGLGKTGAAGASGTASSARSRDVYRHYAAALYRQALLTSHDSAVAEHVACDVIVNERALALVPTRSENSSRYRLAESIFRRCQQLVAGRRRLSRM